jgi:peptidoglycan/xylan/chitin deacetylase (PgdA/CDA1 family)
LASAAGLSFAAEGTNPLARQAATTALEKLSVKLQGGAIIRGKKAEKRLAVVFTGHSHGEGGEIIMNELAKRDAKGSFFFTGDFLTNMSLTPLVHRVVKDGHYLGPHSDKHLLYCSWEAAKKTLVTRQEFMSDMAANLQTIEHARMKALDPS